MKFTSIIKNDDKIIKYTVTRQIPKERYYEIILVGDANDGDYVTSINKYTQKEFDKAVYELYDLMKIIGKSGQLEDRTSEHLWLPCDDYGSCHSLEKVNITMYDVDGYVYDVTITEELC